MRVRSLLAALVAGLLFAASARPEAVQATLVVKETLGQSFVGTGHGATRTYSIRDARKVAATFALPGAQESSALDAGAPFAFDIGSLHFEGMLGDDRRWKPGRRGARFPLNVPGPGGQPRSVGAVTLAWKRGLVTARVKGKLGGYLDGLVAPAGASDVSIPSFGSFELGPDAWYFAGTAAGRAHGKRVVVVGATYDLARASAKFVGAQAVDPRGPSVRVDSPAEGGFVFSATLHVSGSAKDVHGVGHVFWQLDAGAEAETAFAADVPIGVRGGQHVVYAFGVPLSQQGSHTLRMRVVNVNGAETVRNIYFTFAVPKDYASIATGLDCSFVIRDGLLYDWGADGNGQLGDNRAAHTTPTVVDTGGRVASVACGYKHTVVLHEDGTVAAAGYNSSGQLGDGTLIDHYVFKPVTGLTGIVQVAIGSSHTVALKADGTVWCWGHGTYGQCGNGAPVGEVLTPAQLPGFTNVVAVAAGYDVSYAILSDGTALAWGSAYKGLTTGSSSGYSSTPRFVQGGLPAPLAGIVQIASSDSSLALLADGTVWAWGMSFSGSISDGLTTSHTVTKPFKVPGVSGAVAVASASGNSAALLADGTVLTWGTDFYGQLGDGKRTQRNTAALVPGLTGVARIASSTHGKHFLAQLTSGALVGWGTYTVGTPPNYANGSTYHLVPEVISLP